MYIRNTKTHGLVIWLTGLPCSGKTTLSLALADRLNKNHVSVEILDGDILRKTVSKDLGFSKEDREENIRRAARIAKIYSETGKTVIAALVSPYQETRHFVRSMCPNFMEVYLKCDIEICKKRDVKGMYAKAMAGEITDFTGVQDVYEEPINPELILETGDNSLADSVEQLLHCLKSKQDGYICEKSLAPIFIVGAPRSGTTWLWGLLTSHPEVVSMSSEDFDPETPSIVNGKRLTSETGAFVKYADEEIIGAVSRKAAIHPGKTIIEKTPRHIFHLDRILSLFPDAKIIFMMRDPRAVISSMLHSKFFKFAESFEGAIEKYRNFHLAAQAHLSDSRVLKIRYEDLKLETEKELEKILDFMGLAKRSIQNIIDTNEDRTKVDIEGVFRKGLIDSYKQDLAHEEIEIIERELKDEILSNGYEIE